jgi:hypothetical protein
MQRPSWAPEGIDIERPNAARMYDYALGGMHNFAVDRALVEQAESLVPGASRIAYANRAYLGRVVRYLAAEGVRQFLDIGSGIPTAGNVHQIAHEAAPGAKVLYVDIDPVAVAHGESLLADDPDVHVIEADLRHPGPIVEHAATHGLLDFTQPVAVLLIAVLHFLSDDDDPRGIIAGLHDAVAPGSYLALSHGTPPPARTEQVDEIEQIYRRTPTPLHLRTPAEVLPLLDGWHLVPPGLVAVTDWHPDPDQPEERQDEMLGAVARR